MTGGWAVLRLHCSNQVQRYGSKEDNNKKGPGNPFPFLSLQRTAPASLPENKGTAAGHVEMSHTPSHVLGNQSPLNWNTPFFFFSLGTVGSVYLIDCNFIFLGQDIHMKPLV